jgi:membrane associated rhomboid family serine protease
VLNLFGLLLVGPILEERFGRGRFLLFYLVCGTAGPAAHIALSLLGVLRMDVYTPLVGASASIYGVLVAAARIAPDELVMLAFPPIDLRLRTFALILIGVSLAAVALNWQNTGGHAAHLGGAVAGWWLSRNDRPGPAAA